MSVTCSKDFSITVADNEPCNITDEGGGCLALDEAFSNQYTATGGTAPYTFTISSGSVPTGMAMAANGLLSGTPTASGFFNFTVMATDAALQSCTKDVSIQVSPACGHLYPVHAKDLVWFDDVVGDFGQMVCSMSGAGGSFSCNDIPSCVWPTSGFSKAAWLCNPCTVYSFNVRMDFSGTIDPPYSCSPAPTTDGRIAMYIKTNVDGGVFTCYANKATVDCIVILGGGVFSGSLDCTFTLNGPAVKRIEIAMSVGGGSSISGTVSVTPLRHP